MSIRRDLGLLWCLLGGLLWPALSLSTPKMPEVAGPTCADLRDNDRNGLRDAADPSCAASLPLTACGTGLCAEAVDGLLVAPLTTLSDTDVDGTVDVVTLPFGQDYAAAKHCFGIDVDFTGYVWLRLKGTGSVWVTIPGDAGHTGTPDNHFLTKVANTEYDPATPIGQRIDANYHRGVAEGDVIQRQFVINGTPTASQLCVAMTGGLQLRSVYLDPSATATPRLPAAEPSSVVHYRMFELGEHPAPAVDDAVWTQANSVMLGGLGANLPLEAPATMKAVYKEGTPDRIYVRWEKTLADQAWIDVAPDSPTIGNYTASVFYIKADSLTRVQNEQTWVLGASPHPDHHHYDATWPSGVFSIASNLSNVDVTVSVSGSRRRIQLAFDAPMALSEGQQFLCGFRDNERITGGILKYQYAFNVDPTLGYLGLCEAAGTIPPLADDGRPTVASTTIDCPTASSCTVTVTGSDAISPNMTTTLQIGTSPGAYTETQGPVNTTGDCTVSCTSLITLSGRSASTPYFVLATLRDQAGNTDAGSEATDTTPAGGATFWIATKEDGGRDSHPCTEAQPCAISRLAATSEPRPSPGETWLLKDGTYPIGTKIDCAAGSRNGEEDAKITIKAEHERKAFIHTTAATGVAFFEILNCRDYVLEGLRIGAATGTLHTGTLLNIQGTQRTTLRRLLLHHSTNTALASAILIWRGQGGHLVEENECYFISRYCLITKREGSGTYRNNYTHTRAWQQVPGALPAETFRTVADAAITVYPDTGILIEDHYSEKTSVSVNSETDNATPVSGDSRYYGGISLNEQHGVKIATHAGPLMRQRNWDIRDLLVISPLRVGAYLRAVTNVQISKSSFFMTNRDISNTIIADKASNQFDPGTLSLFIRDTLVHGLPSKKAFTITPHYVDYGLTNMRLFQTSGTTPTSSPNYVNVTTSDPGMGTAKVCIPTTSNLKEKASDGGDIGANVLYRYIDGVKTTQKRWTTSKPASCPANVSGIYPYGLGACIAGINNTVADSFVGIADRLGMTISQVETTCGAGASYFP